MSTEDNAPPATNSEIFIRVLTYANIDPAFYTTILAPARCKTFRTAMSLDQAQKEQLLDATYKTEDRGMIADCLQFMKLLRAADHFKFTRSVLTIPWRTMTEEMILDMIDDRVEIERVKIEVEQEARVKQEASVQADLTMSMTSKKSTASDHDVIDLTGGDLGFAKKSLKAFSDMKFPTVPVKSKELKALKIGVKNVMRSMNMEHLVEEDYEPPLPDTPSYKRYSMDNKFFFSVIVQFLLMRWKTMVTWLGKS